ncbi:MAG: T9SS type A sorting domain-containing protein [Phaeodactylibacter sp.]|nr:T9SS type A sorting domain-containing protein [Phaeodactylibacter sp.]
MKNTSFTKWLLCCLLFPLLASAQEIELKNNFFYLDGQKFFLKGIGYEVGATPGELPWARTFNPEVLHADMQRILAGGFNTIRTWAPFTEQELSLLQEYDIKIIMGIWIDPHADFSQPAFVNQARSIVADVLSYSKNYDNIIAYLIMNEPLPETIAAAGYEATEYLWKELIQIIHAEHPGRPVSIANTSNGTYINPAVFDFSAYNVYIYNPVTVNYLHGYRDFVRYLQQLNVPGKPLVITEYGLSVSPSGPGAWGYGGNSLQQQLEGDLHMYKSLVDGGAAGSFLFNYSDGWWKGGDEFVHNDSPEEWFGLVGYSSLSDEFGTERPVWDAARAFQSAVITQPRSSEIYSGRAPVEAFLNSTIARVEAYLGNERVFQQQITDNYLLDTLEFAVQDLRDATLIFHAYDAAGNLVKTEEKNILITGRAVVLPTIGISITDEDFWQGGQVEVNYQVTPSPDFVSGTELQYIFYPHVGFNYGQQFQRPLPEGPLEFSSQHYVAPNVDVFTVGAAFDVAYNSFSKRIVNQLTLSRINDLVNSSGGESLPMPSFRIIPNPAKDHFMLAPDGPAQRSVSGYTIYSLTGMVVQQGGRVEWNQPVSISRLMPGIYFLRLEGEGLPGPLIRKMIKY